VIDEATSHDGHCLEAAVRVLREAGHHLAVVHAKAIFPGEILANPAPGQRHRGPGALVAGGVCVVVVDAEEKGSVVSQGKPSGRI